MALREIVWFDGHNDKPLVVGSATEISDLTTDRSSIVINVGSKANLRIRGYDLLEVKANTIEGFHWKTKYCVNNFQSFSVTDPFETCIH